MKHLIAIAMLAFAILTGCSKTEISPPILPPGNDTIPKKDTIPVKDTVKGVPAPFGIVDAPFIAVTIQDQKTGEYWVEKYKLDGSVRAYMLAKKYEELPFMGFPGFTSKAERMAIGSDSSLYMVDLNTQAKSRIYARYGHKIGFPTFNADASRITFTLSPASDAAYSDLYVVDAVTGANLVSITGANYDEIIWSSPAFSNNSRFITYSSWGTLYVYDLQEKEIIELQNDYTIWNEHPVFTKDDQHIIYSSFTKNWDYSDLYITEFANAAVGNAVRFTNISSMGPRYAGLPVLSDDGNTVYFIGTKENGTINLYKKALESGNIIQLAENLAENKVVTGMAYIKK